jgi:hypothetical protein
MVAIELAGSGTVQRIALRNLSPATAEAYAQRGPKTITRDVNRLVGLSLVTVSREDGDVFVKANLDEVRGMRPFVHRPAE